jgi:hypothetical protein
MFVISEAEAAAIRATYEQRGEISAAVELRQLFPGITDNAQARLCVRTIASWPPPKRLRPMRLRSETPADGVGLSVEAPHELRGSRTVNSLYSPTQLSTLMLPPCCCVMMS